MPVLTEQSLLRKDWQEFLRHFLRVPTYVPLLLMLRVLGLLGARVFDPINHRGGVHRYVTLLHLQRLGSGSLGNPLR